MLVPLGEYAAHQIWWPFAGVENLIKKNTSETKPINKYLVPIDQINISNKCRDLVFIAAQERVYFLNINTQKTIYTQLFPDYRIRKPKEFKNNFEIARDRFLHNLLDCKEFEDIRILKLGGGSKSLFALAINHKQEFVIAKISLSATTGFGLEPVVIKKIQTSGDNLPENHEILEFYADEVNDFESQIFVFIKSLKKVLTGVFKINKDGVVLNDLSSQSNSPFITDAFCLVPDRSTVTFAAYDRAAGQLKLYQKYLVKDRWELVGIVPNISADEYFKICYFSIKSGRFNTKDFSISMENDNWKVENFLFAVNRVTNQQLMNPNNRTNYEFIEESGEVQSLNFTSSESPKDSRGKPIIPAKNIRAGIIPEQSLPNIYPLIGKGKVSLEKYDNTYYPLTLYHLPPLTMLYAINGSAVIFGNAELGLTYALLTPKTRELFFAKVHKDDSEKSKLNDIGDS